MGLKDLTKKWRKYSELSNLGIIVRRKFFNNAFDGALTCAGILSGSFIIFLSNPQNLTSAIIIITGFSTALAIGISGLWGAFLSEEAERKKKMIDLKKEMIIFEEEEEKTNNKEKNCLNNHEKEIFEDQEIQKAMVAPINLNHTDSKRFFSLKGNPKKKRKKKNKSIIEQSERFATIVASLVDGGAPVLGSILPLIPFFFGDTLSILHFYIAYAVLVAILIYLGIFLGKISGGGHAKYAIHLVTAGVTTLLVSLLLQLVIPT
jgi:VIT1/CCC1 family predicted Fe2+/Mn2+ transporter